MTPEQGGNDRADDSTRWPLRERLQLLAFEARLAGIPQPLLAALWELIDGLSLPRYRPALANPGLHSVPGLHVAEPTEGVRDRLSDGLRIPGAVNVDHDTARLHAYQRLLHGQRGTVTTFDPGWVRGVGCQGWPTRLEVRTEGAALEGECRTPKSGRQIKVVEAAGGLVQGVVEAEHRVGRVPDGAEQPLSGEVVQLLGSQSLSLRPLFPPGCSAQANVLVPGVVPDVRNHLS